jgi:tetratricopeptide (TPR) repeat protein
MAECYHHLNMYENALKSCVKSINIDPYFYLGYYEMGYIYRYILGDLDSALICYSCVVQIVELLPEIDDTIFLSISHQNIGSILLEKQKIQEGLKHLEKSTLLNPGKLQINHKEHSSNQSKINTR